MDINTFRGIASLMALIAFVGVWVWAWSKRRAPDFDEAANQLLSEEEERIHQRSIEEVNR
ncbi:MAG TPA: CcoQ/FixQ family Cbb3-type cytochrome c oxidase assembly chaperone [Gammaproteobacteria bacterium]|nr:CcoQ/FixQ family Cbb3-type cytochrome c oxidase assembly chaperone [Gammaproteobacteria bacterium]